MFQILPKRVWGVTEKQQFPSPPFLGKTGSERVLLQSRQTIEAARDYTG
ncbi:MAG: hypothetical protein KKA60_02835 [Proteobacteria bacterium]|nr:hypothetical protein [Pseudomonadota bacterium]